MTTLRPARGLGRSHRHLCVDGSGATRSTPAHAHQRTGTSNDRGPPAAKRTRCLKADRTASVMIRGHAFIQNLRRGHYELGTETPRLRIVAAFEELIETS